MFRAAAMIAKTEKANFLITGENLAQVSSQTLSNLTSITTHVPMEIVRPLLTYDKQEIIEVAKQIGTYALSKGPEICNLLAPKKPSTKSNPEEISIELEKLDLKGLLQECINKERYWRNRDPNGSPGPSPPGRGRQRVPPAEEKRGHSC